jgi:zinc protease
MALVASGVGKFGQEELDALIGKRQIGFDFDVAGDAFRFTGQTNKEDLPDQLRLFAAKLAAPAWDPNPVIRAKTAMLSGYAGLSSSPDAVLGRDLERLLHSGDPRWGIPTRATIEATTPASFRKLWEPLLASGPIEVEVFGDMDSEATIKAVAETFGALKPRPRARRLRRRSRSPRMSTSRWCAPTPASPNQAAAVIAWPTGGGSAGITESRKLDVLAAIFRDRLIDQLRSQAGSAIRPTSPASGRSASKAGGKLIALGMVPPDKTDFFFSSRAGSPPIWSPSRSTPTSSIAR